MVNVFIGLFKFYIMMFVVISVLMIGIMKIGIIECRILCIGIFFR